MLCYPITGTNVLPPKPRIPLSNAYSPQSSHILSLRENMDYVKNRWHEVSRMDSACVLATQKGRQGRLGWRGGGEDKTHILLCLPHSWVVLRNRPLKGPRTLSHLSASSFGLFLVSIMSDFVSASGTILIYQRWCSIGSSIQMMVR